MQKITATFRLVAVRFWFRVGILRNSEESRTTQQRGKARDAASEPVGGRQWDILVFRVLITILSLSYSLSFPLDHYFVYNLTGHVCVCFF